MTIIIIWLAILFTVLICIAYAVGSAFGDSGWEAVFSLLAILTFWGGVVTLMYYTLKEIGKLF